MKSLKTYGKSSQDIFEFHGGSEGELDIAPRMDLSRKAGKRGRHRNSKIAETVNSQASQDDDATRKLITSSGGDTELLSSDPKPHEISSAFEKDVSLQSSMPPPASKVTSCEQSQRSESSTMPTIADPMPPKPATSNLLPPVGATYFEIRPDDQMPTLTKSPRGEVDEGRSQGFVQSGNLYPTRPNVEMKEIDLQATKDPVPSSSASEISPGKTITIERMNQAKVILQELNSHFDNEHVQPQLESNVSAVVNPVVLLPAPPDTDGDDDELSLSIPEKPVMSPTKPSRVSKRKRTNENGSVDELGSDDNAIEVPKEQYKPRPSKRRSGDGVEDVFIPTDFSKKPEAIGKAKRKTKRHKTTAFQELLPKDEDGDEEVKVAPNPRYEIPEKKTSKPSLEIDEVDVDGKDDTDEIGAEAQPVQKPAAKATVHKKRGRPKKIVTNLSEETVAEEAEADSDQQDSEAEELVISATAKKSRKKTNTKETSTPIIDEQDHNNGSNPAVQDDTENLPVDILNVTHGNIIPLELAAKPMSETSPTNDNALPETPRKSATQAPKGLDKHSPISSGKVAYRVGLSKRARIAPLLRIVRK